MQRCLQLAALGEGYTAPNPLVGAVLVHEGLIIGEGYHRRYGEPHAEVNCLDSVPRDLRPLISSSTLYVSLEPCVHHGKTPPCADLILAHQIRRVVVGCEDRFAAVSGKGIAKLREGGVQVITGVMEEACQQLNRRFFVFHEKKRPYLVLKWARSADGFMAPVSGGRLRISGAETDRLVHRWRSEEAGILIGSRTAAYDDPQLTNRLWRGPSPIRIVLDRSGRISDHLQVFQGQVPTLVFTRVLQRRKGHTEWLKVFPPQRFLEEVMGILHERKILSVMVEGGASILKAFLEQGWWDEIREITGQQYLREGLAAPTFHGGPPVRAFEVGSDLIRYYKNDT